MTTSSKTPSPRLAVSGGGRRRRRRLTPKAAAPRTSGKGSAGETAVSAAKADPWVKARQQQVDADVDSHHGYGGHGDKRLNDRHVARRDGFDRQAAHAGVREDA